jgi:hypothetical protein
LGGGVGGGEGEVEVGVGGGEGEGGGVGGAHGWRVVCGGGGVESGEWGGWERLGDGWDDGGAERVPGRYFMAWYQIIEIFERYLI